VSGSRLVLITVLRARAVAGAASGDSNGGWITGWEQIAVGRGGWLGGWLFAGFAARSVSRVGRGGLAGEGSSVSGAEQALRSRGH